jgi:hypothetical protein
MKQCTKCLLTKPLSEFYAPKGRTTASGAPYYLPSCKQCFAAYYKAHREHQLANTKENHARRRYGISRAEYDALVAGPCAGCGRTDVRRVIDHCHTRGDGHVRGVLCDGCNVALGGAMDDPAVLRRLAAYVEESKDG